MEEDTLTGSSDPKDWGLELAADAVQRARGSNSVENLERVLAHARLGIERRLAEGLAVERQLIDGVGLAASEVAAARADAAWGRWALSIYASLGRLPPAVLSERLAGLPASELALLAPAAQRAFDSATGRAGGSDAGDQAALTRLLGSAKT